MEQQKNYSVWIAAGLLAMLMIGGLFAVNSGKLTESDVETIVASQLSELSFPTAEEVASLVVVPQAEVPEAPVFEVDEKVNDLWEALYNVEIGNLKGNASVTALAELEDDGDYEALEDYLKASIEGFDELDFDYVENHTVEKEVNVLELGLEDDEDKVAEVIYKIRVRYSLVEGEDNDFRKYVKAVATVTYEEGDFSKEHVELTFAEFI